MKNKFVPISVALLTLLTLSACVTHNPSSSEETLSSSSEISSSSSESSSSSASSSSGTTPVTSDWTSAQKSLMQAHLAGYVMPYISLSDDVTVEWYAEWECVSIESAKSPQSKITDYKNILNAANFGMEYDSDFETWEGSIRDSNYNEIFVQLYYQEGFVCDVYLTEAISSWPEAQIKNFLGNDAVIPSVSAPAYYYVPYHEDGEEFDLIVAINAASQYANYATILTNQGWEVVDNGDYKSAKDNIGVVEIDFYPALNDLYIVIYPNEDGQGNGGTDPEPTEGVSTIWPVEAINEFFGITNAADIIPAFNSATLYKFGVEEWEISDDKTLKPWLYIVMEEDSFTLANTEDVFLASLEAMGYTIDDSQYDYLGYEAISSDKTIYLNFYFEEGMFAIFFIEYNVYYGIEQFTSWPTAMVANFVNNSSVVVPSATGSSFEIKSLNNALEISIPTTDGAAAISAYEGILTAAGWTVTDHVAIDKGVDNSSIQIEISSTATKLVITITHYVVPLPAGVFDFTNENQLTKRDSDESIWTAGSVTMKVEKKDAALGVGGDGGAFFSEPLRLYTNQAVTFVSSDKNITQITFTASSNQYATELANATWTGGTAKSSGTTVTVTATSATKTISVKINKQVRITGAVVALA